MVDLKKNITAIVFVVFAAFAAIASDVVYKPDGRETLRYDVMFKWGLINKKAGSATLTLRPRSDGGFITTRRRGPINSMPCATHSTAISRPGSGSP